MAAITANTLDPTALHKALERAIGTVVAVPASVLEPMLCAVLARGHVLLEGKPGIGKTLLARTFAQCIDCDFRRIQFTNDLMPGDIVGASVWRPSVESFSFVPGPMFANVVLADEINRTSPRTLSCLLEAMESGTVSIDGKTHQIAKPFLVLATLNPVEFHGTYPVPEAALDRFLARIEMGYPEPTQERALYTGRDAEAALTEVRSILTRDQLQLAQQAVASVQVRETVADYVLRVVIATREHKSVALGASPRAALMWLRAAKSRAWLAGRDYVLPDDLKAMAQPVLAHRVFMHDGGSAAAVVATTLATVAVPL
ncbi:MAG: MoxR family ATPase [Planctomycetota bacterium]|nr:MoxR family ATPase [Planctomycetota bacterium]